MGKLSAEHRECVHLVFYEGLGLADVAALQGCPENTVKTRLFHARKKLTNCLKPCCAVKAAPLTPRARSHPDKNKLKHAGSCNPDAP